MELGYPVGVRFHPTDHELLDYYLQNRAAMGYQFRSDFVTDCPDFYGEMEPWVVWQLYGGGESNKVEDEEPLFFFANRRKLNPTAKRFDRKVGSGTWSGQYSREIVADDDDSVVIGIKREFRYEGGRNCRQNGAWLMQEYQITSDNDATLVLCTLRNNPRKAPPPTPTDQKRTVVKMTRVNDNKRKGSVDQLRKPKAKRQKREDTCDQEQEGSSVDHPYMEQEGSSVDQNMEVLTYQFHGHDQDCYYPELYPELIVDKPDFFMVDELLAPTPSDQSCEGNNLDLVSDEQIYDDQPQVVLFQEESNKLLALLLNGLNANDPIDTDHQYQYSDSSVQAFFDSNFSLPLPATQVLSSPGLTE
jgi:hypothetical protein